MATAKAKTTKKAAPKKVAAKSKGAGDDFSIEQKLKALFDLQTVDSQIDSIQTVRGELPLEVQDLEDEIEGLATRVKNFDTEIKGLEEFIASKKQEKKDATAIIKKYEKQQKNVRNNREYDSLTKEIEFQKLEIQLCEKKVVEYNATIESKGEVIANAKTELKERKDDLKHKKKELDEIVSETEKEEKKLRKKSSSAQKVIEERLLVGYKRIRENARNGLAVVSVERSSCGGCFNKIPPQRQLDIRLHKKIIVCEHCGRILVDPEIDTVAI
ncbi:MAG: hypothetical protein JKX73_08175 [Flavobacteriales bacterium]|nr:hypothetical protein [Flavobacteriales bacterium]